MRSLVKAIIKRLIPNSIVHRTLTYRGGNNVVMTFDDGPHPEFTPKVLDLLDEFDARACFFVIGKCVEEFPDVVLEILRRGHEVGNHTYEHPPEEFATYDQYRRDVERCQQKVFELTSHQMIHFRPPRGKLSIKALRVARSLKLHTILWSCKGNEFETHHSDYTKSIAEEIVSSVNDAAICCLHDDNPKIAEILKVVLPELKERDFNLRDGIAYL